MENAGEAQWRSSFSSTIPRPIASPLFAAKATTEETALWSRASYIAPDEWCEVLLLASRTELQGDALVMFERLPLRPVEVTNALRSWNRSPLAQSWTIAICWSMRS